MVKKWISGIVITILFTGILTACGAKDQVKDKATDTNTPVTLKLHFWYNEQQDNWNTVYKEFKKKYPNINIEAVTAGDNNATEYLKKLDLAAASGDEMDVIMFSGTTPYAQRAAINLLEPLNSYIEKDGYKVSEEYQVDPKIRDKYYSLPGKSSNPYLVLLNKNHLDEANLPVPKDWTWDEFLDYSKKLTKGDGANKRYGTFFYTWVQYVELALMNQMENINLVKDDGKTSNMDNPLIRRSLEIRKQAELVDKSATPYAETLSQKLNYRPQYFNQKASMIVTGAFIIPETGGNDKVPANFKTVFAPMPKVNKNDPNIATVGGDLLGIYSKSKHKEEAYKFIRWYTTEGIVLQGKYLPSWKKADLNKVIDSLAAGSKNPEMIDKDSLIHVLKEGVSQKFSIPVPFQDEVNKAYMKETDKFLLGEQDMDATLKNAKVQVQKIIDSNSK